MRRFSTGILAALLATAPLAAQQTNAFGLPGVAQPSQQVTLSVPVEGVLHEVMVREGSHVEAGQVLAKLDDRIARAAVLAARVASEHSAELEHAQHELRLAQIKVDRLQSVIDSGAVRTLDLEEAKTRLAQASASVASAQNAALQARRNLQLEEARLERLTIRAPFTGIVTRIDAHVGSTLTTATPLLHLVNTETLRAEVFVPVAQFARLHAQASYDIHLGAPVAKKAQARLAFIDPILNSATGTVRCLIEIPNPNNRLPAGLPVRILGESVPAAKPAPAGR